jgi:hypothetical protein
MAELLLFVQVYKTIKQLLHNALNLGQRELNLLVGHPSQVEAQIIKEQVKTSSILVLGAR